MRLLARAGALALLAPGVSEARETIVRSFDGTPIVANFFPAERLPPGDRAPTILWGHGFGGEGEDNPNADLPPAKADIVGASTTDLDARFTGMIRRAGYNVVTWDARGFGESGGKVSLDDPGIEGRDVRR